MITSEKITDSEFRQILNLCKLCCGSIHSSGWESDVCLSRAIHEDRVEFYRSKGGRVIAFMETWRITDDQVKKILKGTFDFLRDSITYGEVLWIADFAIHPEFRGDKSIINKLCDAVTKKNKDAKLIGFEYGGSRQRRRRFNIIPMRVRQWAVQKP